MTTTRDAMRWWFALVVVFSLVSMRNMDFYGAVRLLLVREKNNHIYVLGSRALYLRDLRLCGVIDKMRYSQRSDEINMLWFLFFWVVGDEVV